MSAPESLPRRTLPVHSPVNGELVGEVPIATPDEVREAVARARAAQRDWAARSFSARAEVLHRAKERWLDRADELVSLVARENGKPQQEGLLHEVLAPLLTLTYFADHAERILEPTPIPASLTKHRSSYLHYKPRGVIGIISPWNFPMQQAYRGVNMALMAGNGVVLKPSEFTPLAAGLVRSFYVEAGLPPDLFHVVCGGGDVGAALIDAGVDMIEFTGSVATGRKVGAMCGERLIPCVLELGGKAPALILPDAPMPRALDAVLWGGFTNAGQVCVSVERLLVHEQLHDRFVAELAERVRGLRVGDATKSADIDVGPLVNARQRDIVEGLVNDALAKGATAVVGGKRIEGPGNFFEPTLLVGCTPEMDIMNKETFGPVVPVMRMADEAAMVAEANRSHLGLMAYVFSRDLDRARRVAEQIVAGTVTVNDVVATGAMPETPWHGLKQSGVGVAHSDEGLRGMCQLRHVNADLLPWLPKELWWFPYRSKDLGAMKKALRLLLGRGLGRFRG